MGYVKHKPPTLNDVRVVDPTPVWTGVDKNSPAVKYFMNTDMAEEWLKADPVNRKLTMYTTAGELRQHEQQKLNTSIWDR